MMLEEHPMTLNIGIIGATGIIGRNLVEFFREKPSVRLFLYASPHSLTRTITVKNQLFPVAPIGPEIFKSLDWSIFATSAPTAKEYIPHALRHSCRVIDLSAASRLDPNVFLFCAGVNEENFPGNVPIIACPNCTTSLIAKVLAPLHKQFPLKGFLASTYQSISGAGWHAVQTWKQQLTTKISNDRSIVPLSHNCIPWIDPIENSPHTGEEESITHESKKLLQQPDLKISANCVRVSCERGHGIALTAQFRQNISPATIQKCLSRSPTLIHADKTPIECTGDDHVYYSRIRAAEFPENSTSLWITGDQIAAGTIANVDGILKKWT
ncbi:MAG: hypothetical protein K2L24_03320 [Opitutales bacterium]|nr:hypothetical protein [Opitutales bacterium]